MVRQISWMLLGLIILVAVGLRLHGLSSRSLWLDEALSWKLQSFPLGLMLERTGEPTTTHPPLYFLMLHFWTRMLGDSETAMRSLSVIFGVATIPAMFALIKSLDLVFHARECRNNEKSTTAALLACAFLAASNLHIHHAQQVRGYTLAGFLTVLASVFLVRALSTRERTWIDWCAYVMSAVALCYAHHLGLFSVGAQLLFVALYLWGPGAGSRYQTQERRIHLAGSTLAASDACRLGGDSTTRTNAAGLLKAKRVASLLAVGGLAAGYLPWITRSLGQSQKLQSSWQRPLKFDDVAREICDALTGTSVEFQTGSSAESWIVVVGLVLVWGLLLFRCGWSGLLLTLLGAVPTIMIYVYSLYSERSIFDARYLTFAQLGWLSAAAWLVSRLPHRMERILVVLIPMSWCVYWCFEVQASQASNAEPGMRGAVAHVTKHRREDEIVVAETPFVLFGSQFHARKHFAVRLCADERDRLLFNGESQLLTTDLITHGDIYALSPSGIWLVTSASYMSNAKTQFPANCVRPESAWRLEEILTFKQDLYWEHPVEIRHYTRRDQRKVSR